MLKSYGRSPTLSDTSIGSLQVIATGGKIPNASWGGASRFDNRIDSRMQYLMGAADTEIIVLGHAGYYVSSTIGEVVFGSDLSIEEAVELASPASYQMLTHGGQVVGNIPSGSPFVLSDPVGIFVAGGGSFFHRFAITSADGGNLIPGSSWASPQGQNLSAYVSRADAGQVAATGGLAAPGFGGAQIAALAASLVLGVPTTPQVAVVGYGDSIITGTGDTQTSAGDLGFFMRGLASVGGQRIPCGMQSVGSWTFLKSTVDMHFRSRAHWRFYTHFVSEMGTNDISNSTSLASMQTYATNVWRAAKKTIGPYGRPLQVAQVLIMPRTTSTDSWATAANQTPVAGFAVGGVRDQFNAWVKTQVGQGLLDAAIDVNQHVEDQANPGKWVTTGAANYPTTDGIHPSSAAHVLAAQAVNAWAAGITV